MTMLEAALDYARLGYTVVPVRQGQKRARVEWRELKLKPLTEQQLRDHYEKFPNDSIGIIPSSRDTLVIDVDMQKSEEVSQDFAQICVDYGIDLSQTVTVESPSGGIHVWLQCAEKLSHMKGNGQNILAKYIDTFSDQYIMVPPSIGVNGKPYKWGASGSIFDNPILEPADADMVAFIKAAKDEPKEREIIDLESFRDGPTTDGRETIMRDAVFAVGMEFARRYKAVPPDDLWMQMAWALYRPQVSERDGRTLEQDDRGETMMRAKIRSSRIEVQERLNKGLLDDPDFERIDLPEVDPNTPDDKPDLPLEFWADGQEGETPFDFVEDVLTDGAMSVVYGDSNVGKTFFVFDLACHIALGREWNGKECEPGGVIYIAAEGGASIKKRKQAFEQYHKISDAPLALIPSAVDLLDPKADISRILTACETAATVFETPIRLVVFDTLSRVMAGGNENSPEDMTAVIANIDAIRFATGAHTLIVHHSGKNAAAGARGHSSLRAATDTEIEVTKTGEGYGVAKVKKQRDLEPAPDFGFKLETMVVGVNKRGKDLTSCVVLPVQLDGSETKRLTDNERIVMGIIENMLIGEFRTKKPTTLIFAGNAQIMVSDSVPLDEIRPWFYQEAGHQRDTLRDTFPENSKSESAARKSFQRAVNGLKNKGKIMSDGKNVAVPGARIG